MGSGIGRCADAANHRQDPIPVPLGIFQPLEDQKADPLAERRAAVLRAFREEGSGRIAGSGAGE